MAPTYTRPLEELRRSDAGEFGGKSASLGELLSAGLRVPAGFAISADAFAKFIDEAGLATTIRAALARVSPGSVDTVDAAAKSIGEAMRFAPLPEDLRAELVERYDALAGATGEEWPPMAVRSSALGEDSEEASHAGQQESFLWVCRAEQVCDAVRDCWVSLYSPHAISYRAALGEDAETAMGVAVQLMVDAEISGVMFTCNPVSGDPSVVAVNASWGLGIAVVGGELTPDDYLVSKVTGEVVRQTISEKGVEYVPDADGRGTVRVQVPAERRGEPCLGEAELAALVEVARRIEDYYGSHQDVEWAIARGKALPESLIVLQARPVTTLPQRSPTTVSGSAISLVMGTFGAGEKTFNRHPDPEMPLSEADVREILRLIDESDVDELRVETDAFSLYVLRGEPVAGQEQPPRADDRPADGVVTISAPMIGTFYRAGAPGAAPYVERGTRVEPDTVVCLIEVMKMMNPIPAGVGGTIVEVCAANAEPVEYGAPLFHVQPGP